MSMTVDDDLDDWCYWLMTDDDADADDDDDY